MEDSLDVVRLEVTGRQFRAEIVLFDIIGEFQAAQIFPLFGSAEVVHRQDVGNASAVEPPHEAAADQSGRSGYYIHDKPPCLRVRS
ncbi:hypothetical protein SDC9_207119 [bioreactor metagenome]|uniref:Uncharacterized protein n=1 Tax=bioreactor metagenome TaxID=1076179 RepID=A0A645J6W4_9ZZZZ